VTLDVSDISILSNNDNWW